MMFLVIYSYHEKNSRKDLLLDNYYLTIFNNISRHEARATKIERSDEWSSFPLIFHYRVLNHFYSNAFRLNVPRNFYVSLKFQRNFSTRAENNYLDGASNSRESIPVYTRAP